MHLFKVMLFKQIFFAIFWEIFKSFNKNLLKIVRFDPFTL